MSGGFAFAMSPGVVLVMPPPVQPEAERVSANASSRFRMARLHTPAGATSIAESDYSPQAPSWQVSCAPSPGKKKPKRTHISSGNPSGRLVVLFQTQWVLSVSPA